MPHRLSERDVALDTDLEDSPLSVSRTSSLTDLSSTTCHVSLLTPVQLPPSPSQAPSPAALFFPRRHRHRSWLHYALLLLLLVVVGTIVVLSTANAYFGIHPSDLLTPADLALTPPSAPQQIPKIIHQTWINESIPERWRPVRASCAALHPDWEYVLWTDASGRKLIEDHYPWFLDTFDSYRYPIQRADAIRYFVLHKYGGVYMDLDIGCKRPMDQLLGFELILPQTVPVGVSNDLMFASQGHPFMDFVIRRLARYDHDYILNYPTVMFSTGPMALSSLLSTFRYSPLHLFSSQLHVLSPELYGKNLPVGSSANPFFSHYYGSCWHNPDAGFIVYLGKFGIFWLYAGIAVLALWLVKATLKFIRASFFESPPGEAAGKLRTNAGRRVRPKGRSELLLLPVTWLDERKSRRIVQGRCRCCGSSTALNTADRPPPSYDVLSPRAESDSEESELLFFSSATPMAMCRRKDLASPIHKAFYRLAELVGSPAVNVDRFTEQDPSCLLESGSGSGPGPAPGTEKAD